MLIKDSEGEFTMAVSSSSIAPPGKRGVTFTGRTEVDSWFAYQASEEDYEERDQQALEHFWNRLHASLPELGGDIEIIETANPRTYYDQTRRKLGMVLGFEGASMEFSRAFLPNLFMIGDSVSQTATLDAVTEAAVLLAQSII